jgi:glycosyltransferase involved in cell wall biosynthesis
MKMKMKISIVTISYNQVKYLRECIESVLNQDYLNIEYIIVDAGSSDGSRELIESYGSRIIKIFESDNGPSDGLNKGFAAATGDVFYFINSDDFLLPNIVSGVISSFNCNPGVDLIVYGGYRVNEFGGYVRKFYPSRISEKSYVNGAVTFFQQGMFFKAALYKKTSGFNLNNKSCWDGELLLSFLMMNVKYLRIMKCVASFRVYPESITGSQRFAEQFKNDHQRMYELVYGRGKKSNFLKKLYYRLVKIFFDPLYFFFRFV